MEGAATNSAANRGGARLALSKTPPLSILASTLLPREKLVSTFALPIPRRVKIPGSVALSPPIAGFLTRSQPGEQALIIDAGGGTIDISVYKVLRSGPLEVEELYESQ